MSFFDSNLPACPNDEPEKCRIIEIRATQTCMNSPIVYNGRGEPIDGGRNINRSAIRCLTCGRQWVGTIRELERAQGKPIEWKEAQ
jgi:hypothetical protein